MPSEPGSYTRAGAWGQLAAVGFAGISLYLSVGSALVLACVGYLIATLLGIVGIVRTEEIPVHGPILYPFIVPGFVPLYYFAMQY